MNLNHLSSNPTKQLRIDSFAVLLFSCVISVSPLYPAPQNCYQEIPRDIMDDHHPHREREAIQELISISTFMD